MVSDDKEVMAEIKKEGYWPFKIVEKERFFYTCTNDISEINYGFFHSRINEGYDRTL